MLTRTTRLSLASAAALALVLAAAPSAAAEPTCLAQDGAFACAEVLGGPEAGGAGVAVTTSAGVQSCVAYTVPCPGDEEG